jgi:hypothetical protein
VLHLSGAFYFLPSQLLGYAGEVRLLPRHSSLLYQRIAVDVAGGGLLRVRYRSLVPAGSGAMGPRTTRIHGEQLFVCIIEAMRMLDVHANCGSGTVPA